MTRSIFSARSVAAFGLAGALSACASSAPPPQQVYAPPQQQQQSAPPPPQQQTYARPPQQTYAPPPQQAYAPPPPVAQAPAPVPPRAPVQQPQYSTQYQQSAPPPPAQRPSERQVAIGGTAFPVDGSVGSVPVGSRLVVRVYDAAGGDVNVRVAEGAFRIAEGLPVRYKVPVPQVAMQTMDMPAVAARVEGPRGRVVYRNETAVLLKNGAPGDIPMTLQGRQAASAMTIQWEAPKAE